MKMRTRFGRSDVAKFSCAWELNQRRINNGRKNLFIGWASTNGFQNNGNNVLILNLSKNRTKELSLILKLKPRSLLPAAGHELLFKYTDQKTDQFEVAEFGLIDFLCKCDVIILPSVFGSDLSAAAQSKLNDWVKA
jgi:hypothetical protein